MARLLTLLFLLITIMVKADLGPPSIQAVCRITTSDGKTYEGFVNLIMGGLHGIHQNGFYFYQNDHSSSTLFFDYEFNKLERTGNTKYRMGNFSADAKKMYFLAYTGEKETYWLNETKQEVQDQNDNYLVTKTVIQRKYLMLDTLLLFTELPKYLHLDYTDKTLKRENIPIKDIVSFEVVLNPSETLLNEIEKKRKICYAEVDTTDSTGDFLEPAWVHELIKNPEVLNKLREEFKIEHRK